MDAVAVSMVPGDRHARFCHKLTSSLCGRRDHQSQLLQQLTGPPAVHVWQSDSADEALAFVAAAVRSGEPEVRKFLDARALVVDTEEAARFLARRQNLIVLARGRAAALGGLLRSKYEQTHQHQGAA
jgi:hypothetical protein